MKLQVLSPRRVTGGPEALHQLVDAARGLGVDARIVYMPLGQADAAELTPAYRIYDVKVDSALDDTPGTVILAPETLTRSLSGLRHARRAIWWLSIDNYIADRKRSAPLWAERLHLRKPRFDLQRPTPGVLHFAQSEYARLFLAAQGLQQVQLLTDYLRADFTQHGVDGTQPRDAVVAFNPAKGFETTQRLIEAAPAALSFVRLEKMSPQQVRETLERSAVYIDFGPHPGRDRLPREAALCGCNIVTGRRGAAGNDVDMPIPARFKLDETGGDFVARAIEVLTEAATRHAQVSPQFDAYRQIVRDQRRAFVGEVQRMIETVA